MSASDRKLSSARGIIMASPNTASSMLANVLRAHTAPKPPARWSYSLYKVLYIGRISSNDETNELSNKQHPVWVPCQTPFAPRIPVNMLAAELWEL